MAAVQTRLQQCLADLIAVGATQGQLRGNLEFVDIGSRRVADLDDDRVPPDAGIGRNGHLGLEATLVIDLDDLLGGDRLAVAQQLDPLARLEAATADGDGAAGVGGFHDRDTALELGVGLVEDALGLNGRGGAQGRDGDGQRSMPESRQDMAANVNESFFH